VDVSGFASGTKVKDPWTDKIFLVPKVVARLPSSRHTIVD
jgi:hypothetical protein